MLVDHDCVHLLQTWDGPGSAFSFKSAPDEDSFAGLDDTQCATWGGDTQQRSEPDTESDVEQGCKY